LEDLDITMAIESPGRTPAYVAERCVISGYGMVSALGAGIDSFREALREGLQNFSTLRGMPVPHGKDRFALSDWPSSTDRAAKMSQAAIEEALKSSGCALSPGEDVGLVMGSVWGDSPSAESHYPEMLTGEMPSANLVEALQVYSAGSVADAIANTLGIRGPRLAFNNACASSNIALGYGLDLIRSRICRVVIVFGVDRFSLAGLWGAERSGFVGREMQPFDRDRNGTILGEGASALILEKEHADSVLRAKAWLDGYSCVCEPGAASITLAENGIGLQMSMRGALTDAGCDVPDIDYINAHSPGTSLIDLVECRAIAALWKAQLTFPAVNATKSMTGHMSGASAIAEAIATILQMEGGFLHGNVGLKNPDPRLPIPVLGPQSRKGDVKRAVSNACGGGGLNTSVVISSRNVHPPRVVESRNSAAACRIVITGFGGLRAPKRAEGKEELEWFDVHDWLEPETNINSMNRSAQIGASVGVMAIRQADLRIIPELLAQEDVAVLGGVWLGGWAAASAALCEGLRYDPVQIFPSTALNHFGAHIASMMVCRKFGFTGPTHTACGYLSSGIQALKVAADMLTWGRSKAAVVMAFDSDHFIMRKATAWLPNCRLLRDFVEGGAGFVLEREDLATERGANIMGVLRGGASIAGPLRSNEDLNAAIRALKRQLDLTKINSIVMCSPADTGMLRLGDKLQQEVGARLCPPGPQHSLAGEGLLQVGRSLGGPTSLILAGESGRSQSAVIVAPC
jgi:3-oxoacyl-[acyl-carrier-protein] synthase II